MKKNNQSAIAMATIVRQSQDVVSEEMGDEVVMLRLESNAYYSTNDIGAEIWKRIEQPIRVSALVADLMETFDVEKTQCEQDVLEFLYKAYEEGTITIA